MSGNFYQPKEFNDDIGLSEIEIYHAKGLQITTNELRSSLILRTDRYTVISDMPINLSPFDSTIYFFKLGTKQRVIAEYHNLPFFIQAFLQQADDVKEAAVVDRIVEKLMNLKVFL